MDITAEARKHHIVRDWQEALRLIHAGCELVKDGIGPVMNAYSAGVLQSNGLKPDQMRAKGLMSEARVSQEEWIERGAMVLVKWKKPGNVCFFFERTPILIEYLRAYRALQKERNECQQQGVEFKLPDMHRDPADIATEDFARELHSEFLEKVVWMQPAYCSSACMEYTKGSRAASAEGKASSATITGPAGKSAKFWGVTWSNEQRAALGIHPKPI